MNAFQATMSGFEGGFNFTQDMKRKKALAQAQKTQKSNQDAINKAMFGGSGAGNVGSGGVPAGTVGILPASQSGGSSAPAPAPSGGASAMGAPNYGAGAAAAFRVGDFDTGLKLQGIHDKGADARSKAQTAEQKAQQAGMQEIYRVGKLAMDPQSGVTLDQAKQFLVQSGMDAQMLAQVNDQNLGGYLKMIEAQMGGQTQTLKKDEAIFNPLTGQEVYANRGNQTVSDGATLVDGGGNVLHANEADQKLPTGMRMGANGVPEYIPEYIAGQKELKAAGKSGGTNGAPSYGKTPVYGQDANGNTVAGVIGDDGSFKPLDTGGISVLSPFEKSLQSQQGRSQGKTQGETLANLPAIENNADRALKTVEQLLNHKGIDAGTGFSAKIPAIPGTDKYAFNVANKQANGQVFLQGFEALKGGGVITEVEGLKAEQALARMDAAQSKEDYQAGLNDYREVIQDGMVAAYEKAGKEVPERYRNATNRNKEPKKKKLYDKYGLE